MVPEPNSSTPDKGMALHAAKRRVREEVLALRAALPEQQRATAEAVIVARLLALPSLQAAHTLLLTLPFRGEWDTRPLVQAASAAGKRVVLPRVDLALRMLALHVITDLARDVAPGYGGIDEPHAHLPQVAPGEIDWVLVPGVAFDKSGRRLGYGGGFYDRLLPLLPSHAQRVAGAFDEQVVEQVPVAPHDVFIHQLVSPLHIRSW
jgi:5-formyltetrahydrofolate cyclo-ligase